MNSSERGPRRISSRDRLLQAAASIVAERGVQHLTIEATAAAAGVTKAGLIYHFKTRDELLAALVEQMVAEFDLRTRLTPPDGSSVPISAQLATQIAFNFLMPPEQKRLLRNMLAAVTIQPQLLPPVQALFERDYRALGSDPGAGLALLLSAAIDGMLLLELLQLYQFPDAQRQALHDAALELARTLP